MPCVHVTHSVFWGSSWYLPASHGEHSGMRALGA